MSRNLHWTNANEERAYPLDDSASAASDAGDRLPPDLLVDLALRWPIALGPVAFVAAAAVTPGIVTVTFQAAASREDADGFVPLAVVSVRTPVAVGRAYAVVPQAEGVGGWVVFGHAVEDLTYSGRFSSPTQSALAPRAARAYRSLPVRSLQADAAADRLAGLVTLRATAPLVLTKEERFVDGALRDCVVVSLVDDSTGYQAPTGSGAQDRPSVFEQFSGPCGGRPESGTCGCPEPIEFINGVAPDCNGLVTLAFTGCATVTASTDSHGAIVACGLSLADACLGARVPTSDGVLPGTYTAVDVPVPPPPAPGGTSESGVSVSVGNTSGLPYLLCFLDGSLGGGSIRSGLWAWDHDASPDHECGSPESTSRSHSFVYSGPGSAAAATAATRNVLTVPTDSSAAYRRVKTAVMLVAGPPGSRTNAQLVADFRPHPTIAGRFVYFVAEVDYDTQEVRIAHFDGVAFTVLVAVTVPAIAVGVWYEITLTALPGPVAGESSLTARARSLETPTFDQTIAVIATGYASADSAFGIGTTRALSRFGYLRIEEAH